MTVHVIPRNVFWSTYKLCFSARILWILDHVLILVLIHFRFLLFFQNTKSIFGFKAINCAYWIIKWVNKLQSGIRPTLSKLYQRAEKVWLGLVISFNGIKLVGSLGWYLEFVLGRHMGCSNLFRQGSANMFDNTTNMVSKWVCSDSLFNIRNVFKRHFLILMRYSRFLGTIMNLVNSDGGKNRIKMVI